MQYHPLTRRVERKNVSMGADCRTNTGLRGAARIYNLSRYGCCLDTSGLYIAVGSRILVRLQGLEGVSGIVRWAKESRMGVEFDTPLYEPLFAYLLKKFTCDNSVVWNTAQV